MAKGKTFFGKLIAAIGSIFSHAFKGVKKTYDQLPPEQQEALKQGSGVLAFISQELGKTPTAIKEAILEKFPNLTEAILEDVLGKIAAAFNLNVKGGLEDIIAKLQKYLSKLDGNIWEGIVQAAANIFAVLRAPAGTKFASIGILMEFVYRTFIRPIFVKKDDEE